MKNKFDLIIFDWDGTLMNSIEWIVSCMQRAAETWDCKIPSNLAAKEVIGLSLVKAMDELFPGVDVQTRQGLKESYSQHFVSRPVGRNDLFPGVYEMLVQMKDAGFILAVATGKTRAGLDRALNNTGTRELFSITRCADETASKPEPLMLAEIIEHLKISKQRTLMIGDSVHDLQMAENAGVSSGAVACGVHPEDRLQEFKPLFCLEQTAELMNLI